MKRRTAPAVAGAALVALAAAAIAINAALDIEWDAEAAVIQAVAAVFLGQYLLLALIVTCRRR